MKGSMQLGNKEREREREREREGGREGSAREGSMRPERPDLAKCNQFGSILKIIFLLKGFI